MDRLVRSFAFENLRLPTERGGVKRAPCAFSSDSLNGRLALALQSSVRLHFPAPAVPGEYLARVSFLGALAVVILSYLGGADRATLTIVNGSTTRNVNFGYRFELNAALSYLIFAPTFFRRAWLFLREADAALDQMCGAHGHGFRAIGAAISDCREWLRTVSQRVFTPAVSAIDVSAPRWVIRTEFRPGGGDHATLALGYVQAGHFDEDRRKLGGRAITLKEFGNLIGRTVGDIQGMPRGEMDKWLVAGLRGGPRSARQRVFFWMFIVAVLGLVTPGSWLLWPGQS